MRLQGRELVKIASADWDKMTMQKVGAMRVHFQQKDREEKNHSNKDIDKELTALNYTLGCNDFEDAFENLKKRVEAVDEVIPPKRKRKDRVTCVMIELPCPDAIRQMGKSDAFFEKTYKELESFFGKENVLGGFVHKDEVHEYAQKDGTTRLSLEHIHVMVAPYTKEKGINGKAFETRERLFSLNDRLDALCVRNFCVNLNTHSTPRKMTVEDLKRESYGQELQNEIAMSEKKAQEYRNLACEEEIRLHEVEIKNRQEKKAHEEAIEKKKQELEEVKDEKDALLQEKVEIEIQTEDAKERLEEYNFTLEELALAKRATKKDKVPVVEPIKTFTGKETTDLKIDRKDWIGVVGILKKASVLLQAFKDKAKELVIVREQLESAEAKLDRYDKFLQKEKLLERFQEFVKDKERTSISNTIKTKQEQLNRQREEEKNKQEDLQLEPKRKKQEHAL